MKKKLKLSAILLVLFAISSAQSQPQHYRFEEIEQLQKTDQKNVIVFIYTDWCKFCQSMKSTVFKNKEVLQLVNKTFYFVPLNGEERRTIEFNNTKFTYKPSGNNLGVNELAIALGTINKQINYPTICILNSKNEIIFQYSGFLNSADLLLLLTKSAL